MGTNICEQKFGVGPTLVPCKDMTLGCQKLAHEGRIAQYHIRRPITHSISGVGLLTVNVLHSVGSYSSLSVALLLNKNKVT